MMVVKVEKSTFTLNYRWGLICWKYIKRLTMRILCLLVLILISIFEIGPIPITPLVLIWIVMFRPVWFYEVVVRIYDKS